MRGKFALWGGATTSSFFTPLPKSLAIHEKIVVSFHVVPGFGLINASFGKQLREKGSGSGEIDWCEVRLGLLGKIASISESSKFTLRLGGELILDSVLRGIFREEVWPCKHFLEVVAPVLENLQNLLVVILQDAVGGFKRGF